MTATNQPHDPGAEIRRRNDIRLKMAFGIDSEHAEFYNDVFRMAASAEDADRRARFMSGQPIVDIEEMNQIAADNPSVRAIIFLVQRTGQGDDRAFDTHAIAQIAVGEESTPLYLVNPETGLDVLKQSFQRGKTIAKEGQ